MSVSSVSCCASSSVSDETLLPSAESVSPLRQYSSYFINLFPVWTVLASMMALRWPSLFSSLSSPMLMQNSLSLLMLTTGLTLSPSDLFAAFRKTRAVLFAFLACYVAMPCLAFMLAHFFGLKGPYRLGLLLLSIVSGGQASNLCTQVAGGNTALSVAMTAFSTLAATAMLPLLSSLILGTVVSVDGLSLAWTTARMTLVPIVVGAGANHFLGSRLKVVSPYLPVAGILVLLLLVVSPAAQSAAIFATSWQTVLLPVVILHVLGGMFGFFVPMVLGASWATCVTIGFETAFKSPVLSFVLANKFFPPGVDLCSVVSIVLLAPMASLTAAMFRMFSKRRSRRKTNASS